MQALGTQNEPVMNPTAYCLKREPDKFGFPCHPHLGRLTLPSLALPCPSVCTLLSVVNMF